MKKTIIGLAALLLMSTGVFAQGYSNPGEGELATASQNKMGVGLGILGSKKLFKQEDSNTNAYPVFDVKYKDFYVKGLNIGYNAYQNDLLAVSVFLDPLAGYSIKGKDMQNGYKNIDDRDFQAMLGLKANFDIDNWGGKGSLSTQFGEHGSESQLSIFRVFNMDNKFSIIPTAFVKYLSSDFSDYYFSVSETENKNNSKIKNSYKANGAFTTGFSLMGNYAFNEKLSLFLFLGVEKFSDDVKDSPIVENSLIYTSGAGVKYFF
ncbi:MAG: MipA/OmpV family protein [Fusobacteriaceae bacterium]